jgi:iron complex outermembrane receptor protein
MVAAIFFWGVSGLGVDDGRIPIDTQRKINRTMKRDPGDTMYKSAAHLVAITSAMIAGTLAFAADPNTSPPIEGLQEIVVTAQKRAQNLQDVPIAVSAVTSSQLASTGVDNLLQLSTAVPGLSIGNIGSEAEIYLRGVGTSGGAAGQENAVAVFVDGVYMPSQASANYSFGDIDRIEVLKGPQGTLYGRNATGGAVNIITRTPSFEPGLEGEIGYGNLDTVSGKLYATTGLGDKVAADLAFTYNNQHDGFGRNLTTGADANAFRDWGVRSKVLFKPTDNIRITLGADDTVNAGSLGVDYREASAQSRQFLTGQLGWPYGFWDTQSDFNPMFYTRNSGGSARVEIDFGWANFTSISAYRNVHAYEAFDVADNSLTTFHAFINETNWQYTEELQLASPDHSKLKWIVGLFYLDASSGDDPFHINGALFTPAFSDEITYPDQLTTSYAGYGQATYEFLPETNLTVGARDTNDKRTLKATGYLVLLDGTTTPAFAPQDRSTTFNHPTWRLSLDHKFSQDYMVYASFSTGFHSGVYVTTGAPTGPVVKPETLAAYEVGIKTTFFDQRLQFNASAFHYDYNNLQVSIVEGASENLLNAGKAEMYGLDMDLAAKLTSHFTLRWGAELIHDRYLSFPNAPCSSVDNSFPFGNTIVACNAAGNRLNRTPDYSFNVAAEYDAPLSGGNLETTLGVYQNGGFYWNPDNRLRQNAYELTSGQIKWWAPGGRYFVRVHAENVFNTKYFTYASGEPTGDLSAAALGRTFGVAFGVKY